LKEQQHRKEMQSGKMLKSMHELGQKSVPFVPQVSTPVKQKQQQQPVTQTQNASTVNIEPDEFISFGEVN